jgi:hypothetical protein
MPVRFKPFEHAVFRLNPAYDFVTLGNLSSRRKRLLGSIPRSPGFCGVVWPREPGLAVKSVCRQTAELLRALRRPGPIPESVRTRGGGEWRRDVASLVLDRVLEVEQNGAFLGGVDALQAIVETRTRLIPRGSLARLSTDAVQYAQALELTDIAQLSSRLYFYHRRPLAPRFQRQFSSVTDLYTHLSPPGSGTRRRLETCWQAVASNKPNAFWLHWQANETRSRSPVISGCHKLYISPENSAIVEAFIASVKILSDSPALAFKVARESHGLLRPDKLIAYFSNARDLGETSIRLARELKGCPAHGVPFTAGIAGGGLLSWGIDPPGEESPELQGGLTSWRCWVTSRLASALVTAQFSHSSQIEPWRFALERLRLEGVSPETWRPEKNLWMAPRACETVTPQ